MSTYTPRDPGQVELELADEAADMLRPVRRTWDDFGHHVDLRDFAEVREAPKIACMDCGDVLKDRTGLVDGKRPCPGKPT